MIFIFIVRQHLDIRLRGIRFNVSDGVKNIKVICSGKGKKGSEREEEEEVV